MTSCDTGSEPRKVKLSIGGTQFLVLEETLCPPHEQESVFAKTLKWRRQQGSNSNHDEEIFFDRDPSTFQSILLWLRSPSDFQIPRNNEQLIELLRSDSDFYGLTGLQKRLSCCRGWMNPSQCYRIKVRNDTRFPDPPTDFTVTLPADALVRDLRFVICSLIGYEPAPFHILISYQDLPDEHKLRDLQLYQDGVPLEECGFVRVDDREDCSKVDNDSDVKRPCPICEQAREKGKSEIRSNVVWVCGFGPNNALYQSSRWRDAVKRQQVSNLCY